MHTIISVCTRIIYSIHTWLFVLYQCTESLVSLVPVFNVAHRKVEVCNIKKLGGRLEFCSIEYCLLSVYVL